MRKYRIRRVLCPVVFTAGFVLFIVFISGKFYKEYSSDFDERHLPVFIRPEEETALIVPKNSDIYKKQTIGCFVISAPKNVQARSAIRETWGRQIKPIFILGLDDDDTMLHVQHEAQKYDDIIVEDFADNYYNLTVKVAFAMKNFIRLFEDAKYFLKIDDDIFLNVKNLHEFLLQAPEDSIIGRVMIHSKPIRSRSHKWFISESQYPASEFPPYVQGLAYILPGRFMRKIYDTSMSVPYYIFEDIFFTGRIAGEILNYSFYEANAEFRLRAIGIEYFYPCLYKDDIISHPVSPEDLRAVQSKIDSKDKCSFLERLGATFVELLI